MNSVGEQKAEQVKAGSARLSFGRRELSLKETELWELPSLEETFKVITSKRKPEPLSSVTKPQPLGPCPLSQSTFWPYAVLFPGAVAGQIFCFLEPRGCCFLCCWPGGGSKQPGKAEKWGEGEQVAKLSPCLWGKSWWVLGQIVNGSVPVLASDVNVVWEIGRRLSYEMLGNTRKVGAFCCKGCIICLWGLACFPYSCPAYLKTIDLTPWAGLVWFFACSVSLCPAWENIYCVCSSCVAAMCVRRGFLELHNDAALSESSTTAVRVHQLCSASENTVKASHQETGSRNTPGNVRVFKSAPVRHKCGGQHVQGKLASSCPLYSKFFLPACFHSPMTIPLNASSCYSPRTILTRVAPTSYVFPEVLYFSLLPLFLSLES